MFARRLAARGLNLILVARRVDKLEALAQELKDRYHVEVETLDGGFIHARRHRSVVERIEAIEPLAMLINNAGFGTTGTFLEVELIKQEAMLEVHIDAPLRLCHAALPGMIREGKGAIINVASISAFLPVSGSVNYSASKAYLVNFSRALQTEFTDTESKSRRFAPALLIPSSTRQGTMQSSTAPAFRAASGCRAKPSSSPRCAT